MKFQQYKITILAFIVTLSVTQLIIASNLSEIEIITSKENIELGEPFVLLITGKYKEPQISQETGEPLPYKTINNWKLEVNENNSGKKYEYPLQIPLKMDIQNSEGTEYSTTMLLFCYLKEEKGKLTNKIIFPEEGNYTICFTNTEIFKSNQLNIEVSYSFLGEKAISLLSSAENYAYLMGGVCKRSEEKERQAKIKEVVQQCDGSVIADFGSARLGVEIFNEFQTKYPSYEKFKMAKTQDQVQEPLFDEAYLYLTKAASLPDEFPIRKEVLFQLSTVEYINDNFDRAKLILDELVAKYPNSEYGQKAFEAKVELQELQERETARIVD